jgi:phosphomannomutase
MDIPSHIFKSYDIRGIYPTEINEENFSGIITAIYVFFTQKLNTEKVQVALGHDMRLSSPALHKVALETLINCGAEVIDLGMVSTPTFYFAVSNYGYQTGIEITASHNPKEYNGVKYVIKGENGLIKIGKPTGMEDVKALAVANTQHTAQEKGTVTQKDNVVTDEVQNALKTFGNPTLKEFSIIADPANAMGITYLEELENVIPMKLEKMNFTLDGSFPVHQPDPMQPDNLRDLQERMKSDSFDIGFAPDGDGDRLYVLDEKGDVVRPSVITSILAKELFSQYSERTVVVDQKYMLTAKKNIENMGGTVELSKTGHAFITEKLNEVNGLFAGEASAHYYYKFTGNAESQVMTIVGLLKILSEENKPLSEIAAEYIHSVESGEINYEVEDASQILEKVKDNYKDAEVSTLDGITLSYPDLRISLRSSNTEPLLRLNIEGLEVQKVDETKNTIHTLITESGGKINTGH